jgi:phosphohistidine phosphatase SixA
MLLVRHAQAGDRDGWTDDDRVRPLDRRGRLQAAALVGLLDPYAITAILSSPYRRCVETVHPLAVARGLVVDERDELGEEQQGTAGVALLRSLAGRDVLVCGHGGLEASVLDDAPRWRKGATFVLDERLALVAALPPPEA